MKIKRSGKDKELTSPSEALFPCPSLLWSPKKRPLCGPTACLCTSSVGGGAGRAQESLPELLPQGWLLPASVSAGRRIQACVWPVNTLAFCSFCPWDPTLQVCHQPIPSATAHNVAPFSPKHLSMDCLDELALPVQTVAGTDTSAVTRIVLPARSRSQSAF